MNNAHPSKTTSTPTFQTMLGVLPFFVYGLISIWLHLGISPLGEIVQTYAFLVIGVLALIGFEAGLLADFPRWTYSYLCWAFLFVAFLNPIDHIVWWVAHFAASHNVTGLLFFFYSLSGGEEMLLELLYGLLSGALGLGVLVILVLLVRRSLVPLHALLTGLGNDWTLPSLGLFTAFSSLLVVAGVEKHSSYWLCFIIASILAYCAGAWFYFSLRSAVILRVLSLVASLIIVWGISVINNAIWDPRVPHNSGDMGNIYWGFVVVVCGLIFLLGIPSQIRQNLRKKPRESGFGNETPKASP